MAKFSVTGKKTAVVTTAGFGPLAVGCSATLKRGKLLFFNASSSDVPSDVAHKIRVSRFTVAPTGTGITAAAAMNLDFGDLAILTSTISNELTAAGTLTPNSDVYSRSFNQKYGMEYYPPSDDSCIWFPATNASGIVWDTPVVGAAGVVNVTAHIDER